MPMLPLCEKSNLGTADTRVCPLGASPNTSLKELRYPMDRLDPLEAMGRMLEG